MFSYVMAEDAWQMVYWLVDSLSWDDLGSIHFFDKVDQQYGILTSEEFEFCDRCKTVGEVADFLTKIASEGREKALPRKRESSLWRERVWWLFFDTLRIWAALACWMRHREIGAVALCIA